MKRWKLTICEFQVKSKSSSGDCVFSDIFQVQSPFHPQNCYPVWLLMVQRVFVYFSGLSKWSLEFSNFFGLSSFIVCYSGLLPTVFLQSSSSFILLCNSDYKVYLHVSPQKKTKNRKATFSTFPVCQNRSPWSLNFNSSPWALFSYFTECVSEKSGPIQNTRLLFVPFSRKFLYLQSVL